MDKEPFNFSFEDHSLISDMVVGKPTTYLADNYYWCTDKPDQINTIHLESTDSIEDTDDYLILSLRHHLKTHLNIEPICRCRQVDLDDITDVYVCRSFKYDVYILVTDGLITLTRHIPTFVQQDYEVTTFDVDAFFSHRDLIIDAFIVLSFGMVETIMLTGISKALGDILQFFDEDIADIKKLILLSVEKAS